MSNYLAEQAYAALDAGLIPDMLVRRAIAHLTRQRLKEIESGSMQDAVEAKWAYIAKLKSSDIAIQQDRANEQHYEVTLSASSHLHFLLILGSSWMMMATGLDGVHPVLSRTEPEVFLLPLPDPEGDAGAGGDPDAGKLLRQGPARGWYGHPRHGLRLGQLVPLLGQGEAFPFLCYALSLPRVE